MRRRDLSRFIADTNKRGPSASHKATQTTTHTKTQAPVLRAVIAATAAALLASAAQAETCTRLPLSDVAFGKPAATDAAREKLREYAVQTLKKRGWSGRGALTSSKETVSCDVYLNLGPLGTEYRCLVTATFCGK